jgi:hypothetical protein
MDDHSQSSLMILYKKLCYTAIAQFQFRDIHFHYRKSFINCRSVFKKTTLGHYFCTVS